MSRLPHLAQFLKLEEAQGKAASTLRNRHRALLYFDEWLKSQNGATAATVSRLQVTEYLCHLSSRFTPDHVNYHISALRVYLRWLRDMRERIDDLRELLKFVVVHPKEVDSLASEEVASLVPLAERILPGRFGLQRAAFLVVLLLDTGLRVGEAMRLRLCDMDLEQGRLAVNATKTHTRRTVPISPSLRHYLLLYLERRAAFLASRSLPDCGYLFISEQGGRWLVNAAERGCRTVGQHAGLTRRLYPHLLRHTWARLMLMHQAPLPAVMKLGGWRKLSTVQRYTVMSMEQLTEVQAASSPLRHAEAQGQEYQSEKGAEHEHSGGTSTASRE